MSTKFLHNTKYTHVPVYVGFDVKVVHKRLIIYSITVTGIHNISTILQKKISLFDWLCSKYTIAYNTQSKLSPFNPTHTKHRNSTVTQ